MYTDLLAVASEASVPASWYYWYTYICIQTNTFWNRQFIPQEEVLHLRLHDVTNGGTRLAELTFSKDTIVIPVMKI